MMQDRFAARLRQHLVATADERTADGQYAEIVRAVAGTKQQRGLLRRLTWFPGRVGPFRSTTVRYALITAALIAVAAAAVILAAASTRHPATGFEGTWTSTDAADGSAQWLLVAGGTSPAVHFVDSRATGSACLDDDVKVFTADGRGTVDDNRLVVEWPDGGSCGLTATPIVKAVYGYDPTSDTLIDAQRVTWVRSEGASPPPGATGRVPAGSDCASVGGGQTYAMQVGSLLVSAILPHDPSIAWEGSTKEFELTGSCVFGDPISIRSSIVTSVYGDACDAQSSIAVANPAEAVERLTAQAGHTVTGPSAVTVGGYAASRFHVSFDGAGCEGIHLWNDMVRNDSDAIVYLVDVDGTTLGIALWHRDGAAVTPATRDEAEAIVTSLRIETSSTPQ